MPRYYFHIRDAHRFFEDKEEGAEFPNTEAATREVEEGLREYLAAAINRDEDADDRRIEVTAENGTVVATVFYQDMLSVELRKP